VEVCHNLGVSHDITIKRRKANESEKRPWGVMRDIITG